MLPQCLFDTLLSGVIRPMLKSKGYVRSGVHFRHYHPELAWGKIISFQKSGSGNPELVRFTANIGVYLAVSERFHCNRESGQAFTAPDCIIRQRIGYLINGHDRWFDLTPDTDEHAFHALMQQYFEDKVLPYLDRFNSRDDLLLHLQDGYRSDYIEAQILTLHHYGYTEAARQILNEQLSLPQTTVRKNNLTTMALTYGI